MKLNSNYLKLPSNYLFAKINHKIQHFQQLNPHLPIIKLGIGDVTRPLVPGVIEAMQEAVNEQSCANSFKGYGPEGGYDFLREAIVKHDFHERNLKLDMDEIFVSDGAKSDVANIQELFSEQIKIAVGDPVYPVYVDSNILAGRLGSWEETDQKWSDLIYLKTNESNFFIPKLPSVIPDLIYLCFPNNPTGTTLTKEQLQLWVDYARENKSIIVFDAAYEAYIQEDNVPHSIYECEGALECAIEVRSFSKKAGFTGLRLGYTVVPKNLIVDGQSLHKMWSRRQTTKFNAAPYIVQRAGAATFEKDTASQIQADIDYYMHNAHLIRSGLQEVGVTVYGGVNAPYLWMKIPDNMTSWQFFDDLLEKAQVVGTPGSGFGPSGEGYFRLSAFNTTHHTLEAVKRLQMYYKNKLTS